MEKRLLLKIESAFSEAEKALESSKKLRSTTHSLLESLGDALRCKWGTFWLVDSRLGRLVPIAIWDAVMPPARQLDRDTEDRMLSISEGTAAHVWRTGKRGYFALKDCWPGSSRWARSWEPFWRSSAMRRPLGE